MSWTKAGQAYFTEVEGHPELAQGLVGGFKMGQVGKEGLFMIRNNNMDSKNPYRAGKGVAYTPDKRGMRKYPKAIIGVWIYAEKKEVDIVLDYSSEDLEQWTADVMPRNADVEDPKNQDKYWNKPFEKEVKKTFKFLLKGYKVGIGG